MKSNAKSEREWRALLAAQAVAGMFLFVNVSSLWTRIVQTASSNELNRRLTESYLTEAVIRNDLIAFFAGVVVLHLAVGLAGYSLAWCTRRSFPSFVSARHAVLAACWTAVLFVWAYAANAVHFPWSAAGGGAAAIARFEIGGLSLFDCMTVVVALTVAVLTYRAALTTRVYSRVGARLFVYPMVGLAALLAWRVTGLAQADDHVIPSQPHVIIIGIDSLRPDAVATGGSTALTPHIDQFLGDSMRFSDTVTPLARTFPSWLTILTGQSPVELGARENLLPRANLEIDETLADILRRQGYASVYATDEVRSSNIDESYGFDDIIGPKIGALDFLLAAVNDQPLSNLVANTWIGKALFPYTYVNRGAAVSYRPDTFVKEIGSNVDFDRPTFLAVHLTLPHWPYHWADDYTGSLAEALRQPYLYSSSVLGVDRQFGQLMEMLESKGALENAIVVLLSDHGEALGFATDNLLHSREAKRVAHGVSVTIWGHGNSVLSPSQYQVLFAWRGYGPAALSGRKGATTVPASLEDLTPTVLDLLGMPARPQADGVSLASVLKGDKDAEASLTDRVRFTESGITIGFTKLGEAKVDDIVERGLLAYALNTQNGRLELTDHYFGELMKSKERAVIRDNQILAAVPNQRGERVYMSVSMSGGVPTVLDGRPDHSADPSMAAMWDALHERYRGEL